MYNSLHLHTRISTILIMKKISVSKSAILFLILGWIGNKSYSQSLLPKKTENVAYGMVSGAALLMDIYTPTQSNKKAILYIPGSAWGYVYPKDYNQIELKADIELDSLYTGKWQKDLIKKGYTVFVINHRFAPQFKFQDIIEDCRRAVRFVRFHAKEYDIDPSHIGAMGHSSGANLATMLGVTDSLYVRHESPIDSVSSKVQAVVALAAPFNLAEINQADNDSIDLDFVKAVIVSYMGSLPEKKDDKYILSGNFSKASPYAHVTADDAPTLIYYSDDDPIIPVRQAKEMYKKLQEKNVPTELIQTHLMGHNPIPYMEKVCSWFDTYLN